MKKIVLLIITAVVTISVFYSVSVYNNNQKDYIDVSNEYNELTKKLRKEKEQLIKRIEEIKGEFEVSNLSSVVIFLSDANIKHLNETIKIMNYYGYHGVMALSKEDILFNDSECISKDDYTDLLNKGFEFVIKIYDDDDPKEIYEDFINKGINPQGFYVFGTITQKMIDDIKNTGCNVIIGNYFLSTEEDDLFFIYKYGNMYPSIKTRFNDSVEHSDTIAIAVGYEGMVYEEFSESNINSMFKTINPYVSDNLTSICNVSEAKKRKEMLDSYLLSYYDSQMQELNDIEKRLDEIDEEMLNYKY